MKTLWAIEPFNQDIKRVEHIHNLIRQFLDSSNELEVGYIATGAENELALAFDVPIGERFTVYPLKLIQTILQKAGVRIANGNVFVEYSDTLSTTKAVDQLLAHAEKSNSDLIVVASHTRHGMKRFILGSFAETIIHRSDRNILVVNPNTCFSAKIRNVFYSSDFGDDEIQYIIRAIELSVKLKAELTVFHVPPMRYNTGIDEIGSGTEAYRDHVKQMREEIQNECVKRNVDFKVVIPTVTNPVSELAIRFAKTSRADLIVVSAKSGPMTALMGGSITRKIVRASHRPVLILK
jgi:nucleotide-binding universal stress UspA family protein